MVSREARPRKPLGFFIMEISIYYLHRGDNIPFYIGKTKNLKNRISGHKIKYGLDTIIEELEITSIKDSKFIEEYWINQFKSWGFNLINKNRGGGGLENHTKETKLKISKILKTKSLQERKIINKKISLGNTGLKKPNSGYRNWRQEDINKILKTSPFNQPDWSEKCKKPVIMLDKITGNFIKLFGSVSEASYIMGVNQGTLSHCLTGRTKTCKGYKWKYKE